MKKLMETLNVLTVEKSVETELMDNASWYTYIAQKGKEILEGYAMIEDDLSDDAIKEKIVEHIEEVGMENMVLLDSVSPFLKELIEECHQSDNEMYCIGYDDEEWVNMSSSERIALVKEVERLNLSSYVEIDVDADYAIYVYGGISEVINFTRLKAADNREVKIRTQKENICVATGTLVESEKCYHLVEVKNSLVDGLENGTFLLFDSKTLDGFVGYKLEIPKLTKDWIEPKHIKILKSLNNTLVEIFVEAKHKDFSNLLGELDIFNGDVKNHIDSLYDVLSSVSDEYPTVKKQS